MPRYLGGLLNIQQHDVQWHVRFSALLIPPLLIHDAFAIVMQHTLHIVSDSYFQSLSDCYIALVAVRNALCWRLTSVAIRNAIRWRLSFVAGRNVLCWCLTSVSTSISAFGAPGTTVVWHPVVYIY